MTAIPFSIQHALFYLLSSYLWVCRVNCFYHISRSSCAIDCAFPIAGSDACISRTPWLILLFSSRKDTTSSNDDNSKRVFRRPSIPVIGPIPLAPPLLVGDNMVVKQPTPMQWTTFEEALWIHTNSNNSSTAVDASPIVAIMDEVTGKASSSFLGRYATIAAIMGQQRGNDNQEDTIAEASSVRLYGIGRAVLCDFYNRIPSSYTVTDKGIEDDDHEYDDDYDNTYLGSGQAPILMAEFELLSDMDTPAAYDAYHQTASSNSIRHASAWSSNFWSSLTLSSKAMDSILASQYSNGDEALSLSAYINSNNYYKKKIFNDLGYGFTSPVAAITHLARFGGQVSMMHDARRTLVSGIIAAKRRLQNKYSNLAEMDSQDGPQLLWNEMTSMWEQDSVSSSAEQIFNSGDSDDNSPILKSIEDQIEDYNDEKRKELRFLQRVTMRNGKLVSEMESYGMSYYGAFSSLSALTEEAMRQMEPYYSPSHREREEYKYEIQSFVAWKTLEGIVSQNDVALCLMCTSTKERLLRAYDIMYEHRLGLEALGEALSQELSSCGEECTDLW